MNKKYPVNTISQDYSYDSYWHHKRPGNLGTLSDFQRRRADIVSTLIEEHSSVLDIGCGDGSLLGYLVEKLSINGIGVDNSAYALSAAAARNLNVWKANVEDLETLNELPETDYILLLEVLEHLARPEDLLVRLRKKCRKAMIISVPNSGYYTHRLRLLFGRFPMQWFVHPGEHLRFWTVSDFRWWVSAQKFSLDALELYEGRPILGKIWPSLFAAGIVAKIY